MMDRLLQMIHQRLQSSPGYSPSGLKLIPAFLFDEQGAVIQNPLLLQNEQKVWVSHGEDYRSPYNPVLILTFEKVIAVDNGDDRAVFKTVLDPEAQLPVGFKKWEACVSFPSNYVLAQAGHHHLQERVDIDSHFLQLKEDPQMVLFGSAKIEKRSTIARPRQKDNQSYSEATSPVWPLSHVWIITKAGAILSKAVPQFCLAACPQPVTLKAGDGTSIEAYKLSIQKRVSSCLHQQWGFGKDGHIFSKAHCEFVLTYLEELNVREEVTQRERHNHHGARPAQWQEADSSAAEEVSGYNVSDTNQKQVPRPIDTQLMPPGALGEGAQLTVALVRKREDKHPKAPAQRWAIRHEGIGKVGQWKHSRVGNPLWNKLTYMWPVLPEGQLNEAFSWPLEGSLISNAPPLTSAPSGRQKGYVPVRLRVLRNGQRVETQATAVTAPDITSLLHTHRKPVTSSKKQKDLKDNQTHRALEDDSSIKIHRLEFQQFLERCTLLLNLPFAARRLFDKEGKELFLLKDLQRDQLVYISCGEQWINPQLSRAEQEKRTLLNGLESDVSQIRNYCAMRGPQDLVLEVVGKVVEGSELIVSPCSVASHDKSEEDEPEAQQLEEMSDETVGEDILDVLTENSHTKAHRKIDERRAVFKYPWQKDPEYSEDEAQGCQDGKEGHFTDMALYNNYRPRSKNGRTPQSSRQQFDFREGQIVNVSFPELALGVPGEGPQAGTHIQLVQKNPNDTRQRWILREEDRTFHLLSDPGLVLAVSLPKIKPGDTDTRVHLNRCSVVLQKYKPYSYGVANQKWGWMADLKVLSAFYTTETDQEITAANQAALCTYSVTGLEELHQQGFYITRPGHSGKMTVCPACARALRGKRILNKLPPDASFCCASGRQDSGLSPLGPFKSLSVAKTNLSTAEAESTLAYLQEMLTSLRKETSVQTIAQEVSAARTQSPVKILARRNGLGYEGGQLVTATTMSMLLSMCTQKLQLSRAACRLYTADGRPMLTVPQLKAWAVNACFQEHERDSEGSQVQMDKEEEDRVEEGGPEPSETGKTSPRAELLPQVTTEDLDTVDETLLALILRNPIDVWVSCGEPFLPIHVVHRRQRLLKEKWLQKEKVLADLDIKRHKMRHLQGRRFASLTPGSMMPTKSPTQPVVVEGGWTEVTREEVKLMEDVQNVEVHLSEVEAMQAKKLKPFLNKLLKNPRDLYTQPSVKRVLMYLNGDAKEVSYVWGKNINELLANGTARLHMSRPAEILYTPDGKELSTWEEIERDMLICVSSGESFISTKENRRKIEIRANYARVRKAHGPDATNIVVRVKESPSGNVEAGSRFLAVPYTEDLLQTTEKH
ncbi:doublecortin domain-containing protein 1 isoform X2 [Amia ocellicauda]